MDDRRRDGGTNSTLRAKEKRKHLTLNEHDDDDDDDEMYLIIILSVVLCGYGTWSRTFREDPSLRVFDDRVLRKMYGTTMDEVTGHCRRLHGEELHDLWSSPNTVNLMK